MNYIKQLNYYWQKHEAHYLTAFDYAFYGYLIKRSNAINWQNPVEVGNRAVMELLQLTFKQMQASRERLKNSGLIDFKTVRGTSKVSYNLFDIELQRFARMDELPDELPDELSDQLPDEPGDEPGADVRDSVLINNKLKQKHKQIYLSPFNFLKENKAAGLQQLEMKYPGLDWNLCTEQWSLSVEGDEKYVFTGTAEQANALFARLNKWLNTWARNDTLTGINTARPDLSIQNNKNKTYANNTHQPEQKHGRISESALREYLNR